jgi:hypothetical protein
MSKKVSKDMRLEMYKKWREGRTLTSIAEEYGVSTETATKHVYQQNTVEHFVQPHDRSLSLRTIHQVCQLYGKKEYDVPHVLEVRKDIERGDLVYTRKKGTFFFGKKVHMHKSVFDELLEWCDLADKYATIIMAERKYFIDDFDASALASMQQEIHESCVAAGWYTDLETGKPIKRNFGEVVALMHSELSEALEGWRKDLMDDHLPHRKMVEVELADCIIRILDTAGAEGLDIAGAVQEKFAYNQHRQDHKIESRKKIGGKKI